VVVPPLLLAVVAAPLPESDPFEIEVYGYETVAAGRLMLEQHGNVTSDHGAHLTWEVIYGVTGWLEVATYFPTEFASGSHEYGLAEWRFRVRPRTPDSCPLHLSLNVESVWDGDGFAALELRPIWSGALGPFHVDVAPAIEISAAGTAELEPALKVAVALPGLIELGVEYYANVGAVDAPAPAGAQWHQLFGALDVLRWRGLELNVALGVGLTAATDPLTVKTILGYLF
jgi:hypothetical protein